MDMLYEFLNGDL